MSYIGSNNPEWVLIGITTAEGVMLIGSRTLREVELRQEFDEWLTWGADVVRQVHRPEIELTARMLDCITVISADWADAMAGMANAMAHADQQARERRHGAISALRPIAAPTPALPAIQPEGDGG